MHPELFDELVKVDPHHFQDNRDPDPLFRCRYWSPTPGSQLDFYLSSTPIPVLAFWCLERMQSRMADIHPPIQHERVILGSLWDIDLINLRPIRIIEKYAEWKAVHCHIDNSGPALPVEGHAQ